MKVLRVEIKTKTKPKMINRFSLMVIFILLHKILIAQDVINKTQTSLFKNNSIFVGIGKSNQTSSNFDDIAYQVGMSTILTINNKLNLKNEISYNKIPVNPRLSIGNFSDNLKYFEIAAIPEYKISNSIIIGAAPSLDYYLKNDMLTFFYPNWRPLSVGGNSYIGISLNDILLRIRYNVNTIDSNKTSSYFGLNVEYRFNL
jgi:hypothetical protein